jgi:hypothetical protein
MEITSEMTMGMASDEAALCVVNLCGDGNDVRNRRINVGGMSRVVTAISGFVREIWL